MDRETECEAFFLELVGDGYKLYSALQLTALGSSGHPSLPFGIMACR